MPKKEKKTGQKGQKGHVFPTLKFYFPIIWKTDKEYFFLSAVNVLLKAALPFVDMFFLPFIIDGLMCDAPDTAHILTLAGAMVGLDIALGLTSSLISVQLEKYGEKFYNDTYEIIADRCMEIDFAQTENKEALDQIKKAREGLDWSGGAHRLSLCFFEIISGFIKVGGVIALLTASAPWLLLIVGAMLALSALLNKRKNRIEIESFAAASVIDRIFGYVIFELEDFRFGKDVRLYGAAGMMIEKAAQQIKRMNGEWEKKARKTIPLDFADSALSALRDFGTYFYLGVIAILGYITVGTFSQLVMAAGTLAEAVKNIVFEVQNIVKFSNYAYEVVKFMNYPPYMVKGDKKVKISGDHVIEFKNVSFSYPGTGKKILDNVSITLRAGGKLSVVGLNGAGKTTFIKLLCRLYDVDEGEILFDGVNIKEYDYDEYMKLFSVVFQDFRLLAFTAEDNILLGREKAETDVVFEKVGLSEKIKSLPNGKNTMMSRQFDKNGVELSGGEQQKLALARALFKDAPVVILDEPTAALDPIAEYEIYRQFNDLVHGKTAIYISHRLSSCKFCDRIAVFSGGTIAEYGTHDELVHKENGIYAEMFHAQAQYYV